MPFGRRPLITLGAIYAACVVGLSFALRFEYSHVALGSGVIAGSVLAFIVLAGVLILCLSGIYPRSWPQTVDEAVAMVGTWLDAEQRKKIGTLGRDDLAQLHFGLGTSIRNEFGLWSGNARLRRDCGSEIVHPDDCSGMIIERLWQKPRAELPVSERTALEQIEERMARVTVPPYEFKGAPLGEVTDFLNTVIRAHCPRTRDSTSPTAQATRSCR